MTPAELAFAMERGATQLEDRFCGTKTCKECESALRDAELLRAGDHRTHVRGRRKPAGV